MQRLMDTKTIPGLVRWMLASPACSVGEMTWRVNVLRWGLGFIYLWFGGLKLFSGLSSAELLAGSSIELLTIGLLTPDVSLPLLGLWEAAIGLSLLTGWYQRAAVICLYFHVAGTFLPLVLLPDLTWSKPPLAASLEGQYIFKNLVTIGGALVIGAMNCSRNDSAPVSERGCFESNAPGSVQGT